MTEFDIKFKAENTEFNTNFGEVSTVTGDYIPVPSTAEVGQTIVVKAVDENGKPTAWEAVDLPNNEKFIVTFSGEGRPYVCDKTMDEIVNAYENGQDISAYFTGTAPNGRTYTNLLLSLTMYDPGAYIRFESDIEIDNLCRIYASIDATEYCDVFDDTALDSSLTNNSMAANAKAVGDALSGKADDPYAGYTLLTGTSENPLDFDTITTPGFYKFTIDDAADNNFVNFPDRLWGFCTMEVKRTENVIDVDTGTLYTHIVQYADWNGTEGQRREAREGESWSEWDYSAPIYNDTPANSFELGGIMADPAESGDTQPVRIGEDSKLYTAPGGGTAWDELITLSEAVNEWSIDVPKGITDVKLRIVMPAVEANMTYGFILTNGAQSNFITINWGDTSGERISGVSWLVFKNGTIGQILAGNGSYWNSLDSFKNAVKDVTSLTSIGIKAYGAQTFPVGTTISVRGRS